MINIASYIDHTILRPATTENDVRKLCEEADTYGFAAVCVPPPAVALAKGLLGAHPRVKIATVIGFPFGYSATEAKIAEVKEAISKGAAELDVVINLMDLKKGDWNALETEMKTITEFVHDHDKILKVIIESGILNDDEIIRCCEIYGPLGVDFMKTSTGYAEKGASVAAVALMRRHLPAAVMIKASGGIRHYDFAVELIDAGANRLGCSASVEIVKEAAQ